VATDGSGGLVALGNAIRIASPALAAGPAGSLHELNGSATIASSRVFSDQLTITQTVCAICAESNDTPKPYRSEGLASTF
jgi:hypothetical protein